MVGFLLALPPLLALGVGGVELAHWMYLRQALSLILMDAARAGVTHQARPQDIATALEAGLRQLYIQPEATRRALEARRKALGSPWQLHILQPSPAAFADHADPQAPGPRQRAGQRLIRNDYQPLQHARRLAQGWPQGRGPQSGLTIYEANTLVMNLWWPQQPLVPGVQAIVRGLAPLNQDLVGRRMMAKGYLPMRRQVRMAMQSDPADWPGLADGRIRHAEPAQNPAPLPPQADPLKIDNDTPALSEETAESQTAVAGESEPLAICRSPLASVGRNAPAGPGRSTRPRESC